MGTVLVDIVALLSALASNGSQEDQIKSQKVLSDERSRG